jgi:hypothetical protein
MPSATTAEGTSGFGARRASSSSTSRWGLPAAVAEMELAPLDSLEQGRKALHEPRRRDPPERSALAHPETPRAEVEHRGARGAEIQPPLLDLDEVRDHARRQRMTFGAERRQGSDERVIGETGENGAMHSISLAS